MSTARQNKIETHAVRCVRVAMFEQSLGTTALAERLGMKRENIRNEFARGVSSKITQARLEAFFRTPFWSTFEEFEQRRQMTAILGADPLLIPIKTLRARLSTARVPGRAAVRGRFEMAALLCEHLKKQPAADPTASLSGASAPPAHPTTEHHTETPPVPC